MSEWKKVPPELVVRFDAALPQAADVQRRQMTTPAEANVHAVAIDGTFDDCQALVKGLFNDHALRDGLGLAGVNSINWARLLAQIVYYVTAAVALGDMAKWHSK